MFALDFKLNRTEIDKVTHVLFPFFGVITISAIFWALQVHFHAVRWATIITILVSIGKEIVDWKHPNPLKREGFISFGDLVADAAGIAAANGAIALFELHGGIA